MVPEQQPTIDVCSYALLDRMLLASATTVVCDPEYDAIREPAPEMRLATCHADQFHQQTNCCCQWRSGSRADPVHTHDVNGRAVTCDDGERRIRATAAINRSWNRIRKPTIDRLGF